MNKSKGFTIIELIVVIAIIAILAAIVLVNVTVYINKAKDARVKSDLGSIAVGAGACTAMAYGNATGCSNNLTYVPAVLYTDINGKAGANATNKDNATAWCVSSQLASNSSAFVCVDSSGVTTAEGTLKCGNTANTALCN